MLPHQSYFLLDTKLGTPSGANVSADILTTLSRLGAGLDTQSAATKLDNAYNRLGAPVATDISADIANVGALVTTETDAIDAFLAANLKNGTGTVLPANTSLYSALKAETDEIDASLGHATYGLSALDTDLTTILNAVTGIQNNTRFTAAVPAMMQRPTSGSTAYKVTVCLYDTVGNMEDPDGDMAINMVNSAGTSRNANLYDNAALTVAATATVESGLAGMEMVKVATGRYETYYAVASGAAEEGLTLTFNNNEGGLYRAHDRSSEVSDATNDLNSIRNAVEHATYGLSALNTDTDSIIASLANATYGLSALSTDADSIIASLANATYGLEALDTDTNSIIASLANATYGLSALNTDADSIIASLANATYGLSALDTDLDSVISSLGNGTYGLSALNTDTDSIIASLANATYGLSALRTELDNVDTQLGTSADTASMTGSHFAALKDIHADIAALASATGSQVATIWWTPIAGSGADTLTSSNTIFSNSGNTTSVSYAPIVSSTVDVPASEATSVSFADLDLAFYGSMSAGTGSMKVQVGSGASPSSWVDLTDVISLSTTTVDVVRAGKVLKTEMGTLPFTIRLVALTDSSVNTVTAGFRSSSEGKIVASV